MPSCRFIVRRALATEGDILFDIWWQSVRATHTFLSQADIDALVPAVRELGLASLDTWVAKVPGGDLAGFLVMDEQQVSALFIRPEWLRRGVGRQLLAFARTRGRRLRVDVNEQNDAALAFYLKNGFEIVGRSPVDDAGRPFPLLHLAEPVTATTEMR